MQAHHHQHNKAYLSAYAHNDQILVKEGQNVARGQKIAEMGNTGCARCSCTSKFVICKPVDPAKNPAAAAE